MTTERTPEQVLEWIDEVERRLRLPVLEEWSVLSIAAEDFFANAREDMPELLRLARQAAELQSKLTDTQIQCQQYTDVNEAEVERLRAYDKDLAEAVANLDKRPPCVIGRDDD